MKKVIFSYISIPHVLGFLAAANLTSYMLDAYSMQITCNACPDIKKIAKKFGLEVIDEEDIEEYVSIN